MRDKKSNEWMDWVKIIIAALLIALIVRKFFFSPIIVDGPSMQPTLHDQDKMIVNIICKSQNDLILSFFMLIMKRILLNVLSDYQENILKWKIMYCMWMTKKYRSPF